MKNVLGILVLLAGAASSAEVLQGKGQVDFVAVGKPSMIKIKGHSTDALANLKLEANKLSGEIKLNLDNLKTGIDMRDEHMKAKYLQTKNYPSASLVIKDMTMPAGWSLTHVAATDVPFTGVLKLHGVEKPVQGTYTIENNNLNPVAKFDIKLSDFKIDIPEYLGVKVADNVNVQVQLDQLKVTK